MILEPDEADVLRAYDECIADAQRLLDAACVRAAGSQGGMALFCEAVVELLSRYLRGLRTRRRAYVAVVRQQ